MSLGGVFLRGLTALISRPAFYKLNRALYLVSLRGLGFNAAYGQPISLPEQRFLRRTVGPKTRTIFDVGAHHGDYSGFAKTLAPQAVVHAFEPGSRTFAVLRKLEQADGWRLFHCACGDKPGFLELNDMAGADGTPFASLIPEVVNHAAAASGRAVAAEKVEVITLDDHCERHQVPHIDLLKVDTEGYELQVLKGASRLIAQRRISTIQLEFNYCNVYSRTFVKDLADALPGYRLSRLLYSGDLIDVEKDAKFREIFTYHILVAQLRDPAPVRPG